MATHDPTGASAPPGEDRIGSPEHFHPDNAVLIEREDDAMEVGDDDLSRLEPEIIAGQSRLCFPSIASCLLFPLYMIINPACCMTVKENEERVLLAWGSYVGTVKEPGLYCYNRVGVDAKAVSIRQKAIDLKTVKVADRKGNPVEISAVVTYRIQDSRKAAIDVTDVAGYVESRATAVMKRVSSQYAYDELRTESANISRQMVEALQQRIRATGAKIVGFELTDLSYTPELAESLLKVQQARALISARRHIVEGAVEISREAITKVVDEQGIHLTQEQRVRLLDHLMVIVTSGTAAQPGGSVQANQSSGPDYEALFAKLGDQMQTAIMSRPMYAQQPQQG